MRGPRNNDVACTFDGNSTETLKGVRRKSGTLRRRAARLIRKNVDELESPNAKATPTFNDEGIKAQALSRSLRHSLCVFGCGTISGSMPGRRGCPRAGIINRDDGSTHVGDDSKMATRVTQTHVWTVIRVEHNTSRLTHNIRTSQRDTFFLLGRKLFSPWGATRCSF